MISEINLAELASLHRAMLAAERKMTQHRVDLERMERKQEKRRHEWRKRWAALAAGVTENQLRGGKNNG